MITIVALLRGPNRKHSASAILAVRIKPTISAVFQQLASGRQRRAEHRGWKWEEYTGGPSKASPDCTAIGLINNLYCNEFDVRYHAALHTIRNGELQDWFYRELGTAQFNTELGPPVNIQPSCSLLTAKVSADTVALNWLIARALNQDHATQAAGHHSHLFPARPTPCPYRRVALPQYVDADSRSMVHQCAVWQRDLVSGHAGDLPTSWHERKGSPTPPFPWLLCRTLLRTSTCIFGPCRCTL